MSNTAWGMRRDRPPALDINSGDSQSLAPPLALSDVERAQSSASAGSSALDPYYFSVSHPNPTTPDSNPDFTPITPARDPAAIDRRGLVGVGELATPRWATREGKDVPWKSSPPSDPGDDLDQPVDVREDGSDPSSPWTIEAVDGDGDEVEPLPEPSAHRTIRTKPSVTEESGSEEILYPRKPIPESKKSDQTPRAAVSQDQPAVPSALAPMSAPVLELMTTFPTSDVAPPSSFASQPKAKKRTSDEFLMDHASGTLISKSASLKAEPSQSSGTPNAATMVRKHRSLGAPATAAGTRLKDRRRGASSGTVLDLDVLPTNSQAPGSGNNAKHTRHASASASASASSSSEAASRRTLNHGHADFSHLPPSPSSSSIQHFLRTNSNPGSTAIANANSNATSGANPASTRVTTPPVHMSPSVAHSLLRGTQEGWSALDDHETVEALRKLDGISGKTVHARASVSIGGSKSGSRPGTPGRSAATAQWEGIEGKEKSKRHSALSTKGNEDAKSRRSSAGSGKDRTDQEPQAEVVQEASESGVSPRSQTHVEDSAQMSPPTSASITAGRAGRRPGSKDGPGSARSSFTPKRGSASSTSFTGTPTTSSRDSTTFSASTSATSAVSTRSSFNKNRRNSAGSDVSSVHSGDAASLRDRAATLASLGVETVEDERVPPVPPLPKGFAPYKSPLPSSTNLAFPVVSPADDPDRTISLDVPPISSPIRPVPAPPPVASAPQPRTPSKKWSFSALNLKLQSSSSRELRQSGTAASSMPPERPISFAYTTDAVGYSDPPFSATSSSRALTDASWANSTADADALTARSSMSSLRVPMSPASTSPGGFQNRDRSPSLTSARTPERPGTASSTSTHTTGQPSHSPRFHQSHSSRLTPSAIPFLRRSSSHSLYQQPQSSSSSTFPSAPNSATNLHVTAAAVRSPPPTTDASHTPLSPTKKTSVFGLPALLKGSSSRKSLQAQADKDKEREREREESVNAN
ncbi:hypothetical protein JB92DRAFT_172454 [Gautieria morchelliformis]|nr:hypothetical protein JB92DRAFT_172454 [Gautieria morchelliformis]